MEMGRRASVEVYRLLETASIRPHRTLNAIFTLLAYYFSARFIEFVSGTASFPNLYAYATIPSSLGKQSNDSCLLQATLLYGVGVAGF